jgi:hypothetical protein
MFKKRERIVRCLLVNTITLLCIFLFLTIFNDDSSLWQFGPSISLKILSIAIDTWLKYILLIVLICSVKASEIIVNDLGTPDLGFSIYNPSERTIYGFTKNNLQFLSNSMFLVNSLGNIFKTIVLVSRFDVAVISVISAEITSIFTIRYLLNKKKFIPEQESEDLEIELIEF